LFWGVIPVPLLAQGLALAVALPLVFIPRRGPAVYHVVSILAAVAVWIMVGVIAIPKEQQYEVWEWDTAFESMADRVPEPKPSDGERFAGSPMWDRIERDLEGNAEQRRQRANSLRVLHQHRVTLFHEAMGFGLVRMPEVAPNPEHFEPILVPVIPQSEVYNPDLVSLGDAAPADAREAFGKLHANSLLDFVNADGFGYVKDRTAVAGFRPHGFSRTPAPVERRSVTRVDLIGLVKHDTPKVYLSESLPRMEYLSAARTREPDPFEAEGLKALRGGEDLFARGSDRDVRMIGAIRSVSQCVECHGGKRGDLLGAFTYRIWKMGDAK
jgi:hypothetical protein